MHFEAARIQETSASGQGSLTTNGVALYVAESSGKRGVCSLKFHSVALGDLLRSEHNFLSCLLAGVLRAGASTSVESGTVSHEVIAIYIVVTRPRSRLEMS